MNNTSCKYQKQWLDIHTVLVSFLALGCGQIQQKEKKACHYNTDSKNIVLLSFLCSVDMLFRCLYILL